jgi:hypothetical protein
MRNWVVCGEGRLSSIDRYNLVTQHAAGTLARSQGFDLPTAKRKMFETIGISPFEVLHSPLSSQQNAKLRREVVRTLLEHKLAFAEDWLLNAANTYLGPDKQILEVLGLPEVHVGLHQAAGDLSRIRPFVWALLVTQLVLLFVLYVLAGNATLAVLRGRRLPVVAPICLGVAAYVLLLQGGRPGDPRLRSPAIPLLAVAGVLAPLRRTSGEPDLVGGAERALLPQRP